MGMVLFIPEGIFPIVFVQRSWFLFNGTNIFNNRNFLGPILHVFFWPDEFPNLSDQFFPPDSYSKSSYKLPVICMPLSECCTTLKFPPPDSSLHHL